MNIFGGVLTGAPHDDLPVVFIPFDDRAWGNTKPPANFGGN